MGMSHYPHGFEHGVDVRGMPVLNSYSGDVYWVDSGAGSDGNPGTFTRPFATIEQAVSRCTANNGDIIMLKAGHAQTISAESGTVTTSNTTIGADIDIAGVTVIGMGIGADRPTFTFDSAVGADFKLAANNVTVKNVLFKAGIDALTGPIEISGDDCALIGCEYRDDPTNVYETVDVVVTASTPLRMLIDGFVYIQDGDIGGASAQQSIINLVGADFAVIRNCHLVAFAAVGVIEDATTSDQILIENCIIENAESSPTVAVLLTATTTGTIRNTNLRVASGTTYLTANNDMQFFEVFGTGTDATTGEKVGTQLAGDIEAKLDVVDGYHDVPTADVSTNTVMRDVVGNKTDAAVTASTTTKTVMAYIKGVLDLMGITTATTTDSLHGKIGTDAEMADNSLYDLLGAGSKTLSISDSVGSDVDGATTDTLHGKIGTDTEMADSSLFDLIGSIDKTTTDSLHGKIGTDTEMSDASLFDMLTAQNTVAGTVDAATTDSLHGKLGTDTELADRSLYDQINGAGPAAVATAAAPANDVSLYAALRETYDLMEKAANTSAAVMVTADTIFTIAGGPIEVVELVSVCVTANDGTASTIQYTADPTDGAVTNLSIASASVASVAAGNTLLVTGTFGDAPTLTTNGTVAAGTTKFIVPAGVIKLVVGVGSTTGTWTHHLRYKPLSRGVTVS